MINNIFFDYDGVIQDTGVVISQLHDRAKKQDHYDMWDFFTNMDWNRILNEAPMIENSVDTVLSLSSLTKVSILTCFSSYSEATEKCNHICQILNGIPIILCPYKTPKSSIVHVKNGLLIDDSSSNITDWLDKGGHGILFGKEHDALPNCYNMSELETLIKGLLQI